MSSAAHKSHPPTGNGVTKRKSGSAACVHCHRRKVRCDARLVGLPCSNCRSAGKSDCRIHEKKKRLAVRSILDPVPIRCRPPSVSEPTPTPKPLSAAATTPPSAYTSSSSATTTFRNIQPEVTTPVANTTSNIHALHHTLNHNVNHPPQQPAETSAYTRPTAPDVSNEQDSHADLDERLVKLIDEEESGSREIRRGVRAIYVGHELSNMSFLIRQQRDKDDDVYHFAGNDIPRRQLRTGHDQLLMDALTLPESALADELVQAYFDHVNPGYPIVDEDLFMAQYRNRDPADPPPILLLQAILLVGAHVTHSKAERDVLKEIFFRRAKWLFDSRIERNRDILVQAALLMTWHSDSADDDVAANAHYWVGVAARIATGLGMHRNPVSSRFVPRDRRMWRRLWHILVQFDVMVSLSYGRPQAINLEDSDVSALTLSDFEGCGDRVQSEYSIHFSELSVMISYIIRSRFGLRVSAERRKAVLQEADEALANWSLKLPDKLRLRASDMDPWSAMLHLTYNNFLILLHRPHPRASAYSDDYGPHDAEICSAAAGVIASIFEELRLNNRLKFLWYSGVHTLFTAMIQVRVELRFSNPVLAINALRRFDSAFYSLRELAGFWSHANTILRLFEDSKRLQEDLRTATSDRSRRFSNNPIPHDQSKNTHHNPSISSSSSSSSATSNSSIPTKPATTTPTAIPIETPQTHINTTLPTPVVDTNAVADTNTDADAIDAPRESLDWRQLFSFTDLDQPVLPMAMEGLPELEDEWRQIYWQETPMSDLLLDGGWMHG
ncbi:acetamidase regulatory protein [Aspergillus heteromorphus CBS 117.55]|uniref:Acetamidase regulatory protein n=1 Tax=Aspergillus heteromorphus CBS 117.55 TaxID=1448321 RepID=A0A317W8M3_9EURO|nr:acetamidase regulatory protein [Aspergillus heteromorphus CBS 117.55]PWY82954.1 acetamidase regulatory protein [Aspergillus heteromorphus CBS 117.55]